MKSVLISFNKILLLIVLMLAGCSSRVFHPVVSQETPVSRENALVVMGISWFEKYNDTDDTQEKILESTDLLKDEIRMSKLLKDKNSTDLERPLHYLSRFQYQFVTPENEKHGFIRFDKDVREYEEIAIHEFPPGRYQLDNITIEQRHFDNERALQNDDFRWKRHWIDYVQDYGSWDLPAGKITYTGDLVMYFKTRRFIFGLFTPSELVERTRLVAVVIEDRFDEVKQQLKKEKPWFPVDEMVNQSRPKKWIYFEDDFAEFHPAVGAEPRTDKKKEPQRNKKKYFF
ncbi:MAG: hypothetical protein HQ517_09950 [SAR324 cluster bacterium]|nr:hypothetical protein [SAR324 cluster bacterium]